jgi:tRNA threonylcarbamoyladenosine biosynthesis protein TsaB
LLERAAQLRVLAFDTSSACCSVALWQDDRLVMERAEAMVRGHSEALMPMIEGVLEDAGTAPSQIDLLAVTTGPGAFTGVRIGLAAARGLALALHRPLIGFNVFQVVLYDMMKNTAPEGRDNRQVLCVIDTKRQDVFLQCFDSHLQPQGAAQVIDYARVLDMLTVWQDGPANLASRFVLLGDGGDLVRQAWTGTPQDWQAMDVMVCNIQPRAAVVAEMAVAQGIPQPGSALPKPVYLRPPEVRVNPDGGRLRT